MKATGIVRRIDDLGRVVIPKEIRRTLRIREGDPLEVYVDREGEVILKKYSPIVELGQFANDYVASLYNVLQQPVFICDRDGVIATAGIAKKKYERAMLSEHVENLMNERVSDWFTHVDDFLIVENVQEPSSEYAFVTIIANGDPIGCVIILATEEKAVTEAEFLVAETAAYFLAKQMEH